MQADGIYWPGLVSMVVFYAAILVTGIYASRRYSSKDTEDLMLAGRNLPLGIGIFTMTATWVGGGYLNGTAESVYSRGVVWAQAPWGFALSLAVGGLVFAGLMRKARYHTLLDPFEQRYGPRVAALLFIPALIGEVFWSGAILAALGTTFGTILNIDFETSIILSAAIAVGYTLMGGLWAVAFTDVVQLVCVLLGLGIAVPFAIEAVGGFSHALATYASVRGSLSPIPPLTGPEAASWGLMWFHWIDLALLLILGGIPWQVYFQRVLSARDGSTARLLSGAAAVGCMVMALPAALIGVVGAAADWSALGLPAPESPSLILPHVLRHLVPPLVGTIGLGAIAAAVMSSVDSSVLSASSMFAWNVYRRLIAPEASPSEISRCIRVSIVVVGILATLLALWTRSIYALWYLSADLVYVVLFPQLCLVLFDRRANGIGAVIGALVGLTLRLGGGEPVLGIPAFLSYPWVDPDLGSLFPFRTFSMTVGLATTALVSRATVALAVPRPLPLSVAAESMEPEPGVLPV